MKEEIWEAVAKLSTPGFFVTAEFSREGDRMPTGIESFIRKKLYLISQGGQARKFVFQESKWRIIFTFFPTDSVVNERYALKNKVFHILP